MKDNTRTALRDLGAAWRGSWSDFDGRTLRGQLAEVEQVEDGSMSLADFRTVNSLCPIGGGHWTEFCRDECGRPTAP